MQNSKRCIAILAKHIHVSSPLAFTCEVELLFYNYTSIKTPLNLINVNSARSTVLPERVPPFPQAPLLAKPNPTLPWGAQQKPTRPWPFSHVLCALIFRPLCDPLFHCASGGEDIMHLRGASVRGYPPPTEERNLRSQRHQSQAKLAGRFVCHLMQVSQN